MDWNSDVALFETAYLSASIIRQRRDAEIAYAAMLSKARMDKLLNEQSGELEGFTEVQGPTGPYLLPNTTQAFQTTMSRLKQPSKDQMGNEAKPYRAKLTPIVVPEVPEAKASRKAALHDVALLDDILGMMENEVKLREMAKLPPDAEGIPDELTFAYLTADGLSISDAKILQAAYPMAYEMVQGGTKLHEACHVAVLWARSMTQAQAEGRLA